MGRCERCRREGPSHIEAQATSLDQFILESWIEPQERQRLLAMGKDHLDAAVRACKRELEERTEALGDFKLDLICPDCSTHWIESSQGEIFHSIQKRRNVLTDDCFPFEKQIWTWLDDFVAEGERRALLISVPEIGKPDARYLLPDETWWTDPICSMRETGSPWIFYQDNRPEDVMIEWRGVGLESMRRLTGLELDGACFIHSKGETVHYCDAWGIVVEAVVG